jgi:hypothetical protein
MERVAKTSQRVGTIIAIALRTGNVAVIGEEAFTQVSWDDAFTSGNATPI